MKAILKQVLITPQNYARIATRILPQDQRDAIRPGIIVSHYVFTNRQGQSGYIIISHTAQRAGICFADGRSEWGAWSEQTGTITTANGRLYNRRGEQICDLKEQVLGRGAPSG